MQREAGEEHSARPIGGEGEMYVHDPVVREVREVRGRKGGGGERVWKRRSAARAPRRPRARREPGRDIGPGRERQKPSSVRAAAVRSAPLARVGARRGRMV